MSGSSNPIGQGLKLIGGANNPIIKGVTSFFGLDASLEDLLEQEGRSNREKKQEADHYGNEIEAAADSMKHGYHQKIRSKR